MTTVLVTAATGQIGTALVPLLLDREDGEVTVRATARSARAAVDPRADLAVVDLDDTDTGPLDRALSGVDALFLNTPSSERAADQQIRAADRAVAAGVERLVVLSQYGATPDSPVRYLRWHAAVEAHVRSLPIAVTVLRPNLFLQAILAMAGPVVEHGVLGAPIGDARVSMVDTRDIAAMAAAALTEPGHAGRTYTLTGPAAVGFDDVAAAITAATGRPVRFTDVPEQDFASMLAAVMPPWQVGGTLEDFAHYRRGEAATVDPAVPDVLGRPARGLAEFARDHADRFAAAG